MPQPKSMAPRAIEAGCVTMTLKPIIIGGLAHRDLETVGTSLRRHFPPAPENVFQQLIDRLSTIPSRPSHGGRRG